MDAMHKAMLVTDILLFGIAGQILCMSIGVTYWLMRTVVVLKEIRDVLAKPA